MILESVPSGMHGRVHIPAAVADDAVGMLGMVFVLLTWRPLYIRSMNLGLCAIALWQSLHAASQPSFQGPTGHLG